MAQLKVYLAGPDVFLPDALEIGRRKKELCARYGFEGLFPFDNEAPPGRLPQETALAIYRGNIKMIEAADLTIANLTPFRGPSADVGTVFELGATIGMGKPALGYSNDDRPFLDRVKEGDAAARPDADGRGWTDGLGMAIENFGLFENLMIDCSLAEAGFPVIRRHVAGPERYADLTAFEECLRAATRLGRTRRRA